MAIFGYFLIRHWGFIVLCGLLLALALFGRPDAALTSFIALFLSVWCYRACSSSMEDRYKETFGIVMASVVMAMFFVTLLHNYIVAVLK